MTEDAPRKIDLSDFTALITDLVELRERGADFTVIVVHDEQSAREAIEVAETYLRERVDSQHAGEND